MRLSLRWKIVGGFGVLLALIAVLGSVTLSLFGSLRTVQRQVFAEAIPGLVATDEIVRSYTAQSAAVYGYLIRSDEGLLDQYRQEVETARVWEEEALSNFSGRTELARLKELIAAGHAFQALVDDKVIPLAERGERSQAFRVLGQEGAPLTARVETVGQLLVHAQDLIVAEIQSELRNRSNQVLVTLVIVTAGALLAGVALAVLLPRRLVRGLDTLVAAAKSIGAGNLDQKIEIRSGDEVQELAARFGEMQMGLRRLQQLASQDRELEIAAGIQKSLLQRTLPHAPGIIVTPFYRQANRVGGDWYDVYLEGRTLTLVVGDASGKGIGAALMATVVLSVLRSERRLGAEPKTVVQRANEALREAAGVDSFATLLYATIDLQSGAVRWLNMGHPSPFMLRQTRGSVTQGYYLEGPRNRALGWYEDPGLAETVIRLDPGDRLIFFTDGFVEAKSPDGEVFGEHRFAEAVARLAPLSSDVMAAELVKEVDRFAAGKLDDDLTMLVAEFQGAPTASEREEAGEAAWHSRR